MTQTEPLTIKPNMVPLPYRQVSFQAYSGSMTEKSIVKHLTGKDSYRRTHFVVLTQKDRTAVAAVFRESEEPLFSRISAVKILALPETCTFVEDETVDTGNPYSLGNKAIALGLGPDATLVVRGMDGHVNFIHKPQPINIRIIDVIPPGPPKLLRMVKQVLAYFHLPPVSITSELIDLNHLATQAPDAVAFLIPCRASGLNFKVPTYFLDERPPKKPWTLIGCERSRQIHSHFYQEDPPRVEMCPRQLIQDNGELTLLKCCLLENHIEVEDNCVIVPWGADLALLEKGLRTLLEKGNAL